MSAFTPSGAANLHELIYPYLSLPELNLLAFTFLHTDDDDRLSLALLHTNHRRETQLLCRDLDLEEHELSPVHSNVLMTTLLSDRTFPETGLMLVPVQSYSPDSEGDDDDDDESAVHRGGVLVLGGRKIYFYEHASRNQQDTQKGKQRRLSKQLASEKPEETSKAKAKARASSTSS